MCGIAGIYNVERSAIVQPETLEKMAGTIVHRGPDDLGIYTCGNVGIVACRLSIIDLATGHQPAGSEESGVWVALNGEIYNFRELRKELIALGHRFLSQGDTEVIVHAYEQWGLGCVDRLNGMFAFALHDTHRRRLWLVRDRLGIKPLYYTWDERRLIFSSEIKAILTDQSVYESRRLHTGALYQYLRYMYVPAPLTMFRDILKLPAGHWLLLQGDRKEIYCYWSIPPNRGPRKAPPLEEAASDVQRLLEDSVKLQKSSDVPLGVFLSGGIDSASLVGLLSRNVPDKLQTFTVGFAGEDENGLNELKEARLISTYFKTDHHELLLSSGDLMHAFAKIAATLDDPVADHAIVPTYLLAQFAKQRVSVALSGEGADELFAGYQTYSRQLWLERIQLILPRASRKMIAECTVFPVAWRGFAGRSLLPFTERYSPTRTTFCDPGEDPFTHDFRQLLPETHECNENLFKPWMDLAEGDILNSMLYADIGAWLPENLLMKLDKSCMLVSLEARVPYLDHRLVEYVAALPGRYKLNGHKDKYLLKRAMSQTVPSETLRRKKHGFIPPTAKLLREEMRPWSWSLLLRLLARAPFLKPSWVHRKWNEHQAGRRNHVQILFALLMLEIWWETFLEPKH